MMTHLLLLLLLLLLPCAQSLRLADEITLGLSPVKNHCFRLLNGTDSFGCQSSRQGNEGAVVLIHNASDIARAVKSLPLGVGTTIMALVDVRQLDGELVDALRESDAVSGVIIIEREGEKPAQQHKHLSEDSVCPNKELSFYKQTECRQWNRDGAMHFPRGLRFLSFEKPIFMISNQTEINILVNKCFAQFNQASFFFDGNDTGGGGGDDYRCVARMTQFMLAAGSAEICQRRQSISGYSQDPIHLCDPLEDKNVFALLPALSQANDSTTASVFMLASRLDSFSTFTESRGGDLSVLSSVVALLAVADAIGANLREFNQATTKSKRQLAFSFFHGESLGYIGSSRMVFDMSNGAFPQPDQAFPQPSSNAKQLSLQDISAYLEVQQLNYESAFHLHTDWEVYQANRQMLDSQATTINSTLAEHGYSTAFNPTKDSEFPPSSYHSLMKESRTGVPALLLASFGKQYESGQINSFFDTTVTDHPEKKRQQAAYIAAAADSALAAALDFVLQDPTMRRHFSINRQYVGTLMDCLFYTPQWDCPLFKQLLNVTTPEQQQAFRFQNARDLYISTVDQPSLIRQLVHALLVKSLGEKWPSTESQCRDLNAGQNVYIFTWQMETVEGVGVCYRTSIYTPKARSPAFDIEGYDFASGAYSSWMESVWESPSSHQLELYLKANYQLELYAMLLALAVVVLSIPLSMWPKESWFMDGTILVVTAGVGGGGEREGEELTVQPEQL